MIRHAGQIKVTSRKLKNLPYPPPAHKWHSHHQSLEKNVSSVVDDAAAAAAEAAAEPLPSQMVEKGTCWSTVISFSIEEYPFKNW